MQVDVLMPILGIRSMESKKKTTFKKPSDVPLSLALRSIQRHGVLGLSISRVIGPILLELYVQTHTIFTI
jgi:hypothetical protein